MKTVYLEKYFYTDLVKLILDYVDLTESEHMLSKIPDKYIGNITINMKKNECNKEYRKISDSLISQIR